MHDQNVHSDLEQSAVQRPTRDLGLRRLSRNVGATLGRQYLGVVLGLVLAVVLARVLGPTGNGRYALAVMLPMLLSTFSSLGVAPANVYFVGSGRVSTRRALRATLQLWFVVSVLSIAAAGPVLLWFGGHIFPGVSADLLWAGLGVFPVVLLHTFLLSLLQAREDFRSYNIAVVVAPFATLLLVGLLYAASLLSPLTAVVAFGIGYLLAAGTAATAVRNLLPADAVEGKTEEASYVARCLGYGWKAHLGNILTFLNYRADLFLINLFRNPTETGVYVVAVQIAERLWTLSQAASVVLLPRLSALEGDEESRARLTPIVARWVFWLTVVAVGVVALIGSPVIHLLFGEAYAAAYGALLWLTPGIAAMSLSRVLSNDIAARGRPELNMYRAMITVVINLCANVLLIPSYGITGAAIASSVAYTANAAMTVILYTRLSSNGPAPLVVIGRKDVRALREMSRRIRKVDTATQ